MTIGVLTARIGMVHNRPMKRILMVSAIEASFDRLNIDRIGRPDYRTLNMDALESLFASCYRLIDRLLLV